MISPKTLRSRRKSSQGDVKHRRTRSGCFTCRSRRVKCDEGRPTCERCKKGTRECVYPDPVTTSKRRSTGNAAQAESGSSAGESEDEDEVDRLGTVPDEDEGQFDTVESSTSPDDRDRRRAGAAESLRSYLSSDTPPSLMQDKGISPSPSTEGSIGHNSHLNNRRLMKHSYSSLSLDRPKYEWSTLPQDLQFYLDYFRKNVTHHHYSLKNDAENFMHTEFLDEAFRNDALLYAVVGFSAFQHTLHNPNGKIQDFLQYYNKAVSILLRSLRRGERRTMGTLLAILQLATIEEYLGDWVNLLGHQRAAYAILTHLFTPETIMETELTRMVLGWYCRFDVFAGLMGGLETVLPREWFIWPPEYFSRRIKEEPDNIRWKVDGSIAIIRLLGMEVSSLFAKMGKGGLSLNDFLVENEKLAKKIEDWETTMDPALQNPKYRVTDFSGARPVDPDDIVDPYEPGILLQGPLWSMNICRLDWISVNLIHRYQTAQVLQTQPTIEMALLAYKSYQLFEAVEYWPGSPKGSVLGCQASLGICSLMLPRDNCHMMWCRKKLAVVESNGYIYPLAFRTKMAAFFQDESCTHWWLPNDENYPPIIRTIRNFVAERTSEAKDESMEDVRDMKAIFSTLNLGENVKMPSSQTNSPDSQFKGWPQQSVEQRLRAGSVASSASSTRQSTSFGALSLDDNQQLWADGFGTMPFDSSKPDEYRWF